MSEWLDSLKCHYRYSNKCAGLLQSYSGNVENDELVVANSMIRLWVLSHFWVRRLCTTLNLSHWTNHIFHQSSSSKLQRDGLRTFKNMHKNSWLRSDLIGLSINQLIISYLSLRRWIIIHYGLLLSSKPQFGWSTSQGVTWYQKSIEMAYNSPSLKGS